MGAQIDEECKKYKLFSKTFHEYPYVDDTWDDTEKLLALKICENDIKYLEENYQSIPTKKKNDYFLIACVYSNYTWILDFLVDKFDIDVKDHMFDAKKIGYSTNELRTFLMQCCAFNPNKTIIKHLIDRYKSNVYYNDSDGYNCLRLACVHNPSLDVIKYLIEECHLCPNLTTQCNDNCLILTCWKNQNFEIAKYLIDECKMDIMYVNGDGYDCIYFTHNCENLAFLLKKIDVCCITKKYIKQNNNHINEILPYFMDDSDRLNRILDLYKYQINDVNNVNNNIVFLNTLMINTENRKKYGIADPFDNNFVTFSKMVQGLKTRVRVPDKKIESDPGFDQVFEPNYTKKPQIIFKHQGIDYYGDPGAMGLMEIFKDNVFMDFSEVIELDIDVPGYIVNSYVHYLHTGVLDIKKILPGDFIQFLKFIDRYPACKLSIDHLEHQIIEYMDTHMIDYDDFMICMCSRYNLKYMYLDIHNKMYEENVN